MHGIYRYYKQSARKGEKTAMPKFFYNSEIDNEIVLRDEEARHLTRSLRCKVGETVTVCDGVGTDYICNIVKIEEDKVYLSVLTKTEAKSEANIDITLYQCYPKGDKLDLVVQKAVELGVKRIVPVVSQNCVAKPTGKNTESRIDRLNKIALAAAKQSGRSYIPIVGPIITFEEAITQMAEDDLALMFYEKSQKKLQKVLTENNFLTLSMIIGPEGGFSVVEVEKAKAKGVKTSSLGARILRCETAPIAAISAIMYATDNF